MTLEEIKSAVEAGETVHWANQGYRVIKDRLGQWLIHCTLNDSYIGLTQADEITLNGKEEQFFLRHHPK
jgi:hypothetical protein